MSKRTNVWMGVALVLMTSARLLAAPAGKAITYQGNLQDNGVPANGNYDMVVTMWDSLVGGQAVSLSYYYDGVPGHYPAVVVTDGLFTLTVDFGSFDSSDRYLQIAVRPHGQGNFTTSSTTSVLSPEE